VGVTVRPFRVAVGLETVVGVLHPAPHGPAPCVIACHGMGASKDSDKYLLLARAFPPAGLALARFDFRGSGESGGAYRDATVESRMADLAAVLDHLAKQPQINGRLGLLGSSLGGFVALWVAAERRAALSRPLPVVTWNAPASLRELEITVDLTDPAGPGPALVAEVKRGRYAEAPAGVSHALILQGDRDEVVPSAHAHSLFERAAAPKEIAIVAGADHRFADPLHRDDAVERSRRWLSRHLAGDP
jgi:uncharacterized protein